MSLLMHARAARRGPVAAQSIQISPDDDTVSVVQSSTVDIVYTLTRNGGYSGTVTPSVSGLPTGVTGDWSDSSLTGGDTTTTLTLTAASDATPVTDDAFTVTFSGAGVSDAVDNGTVTVTASGGGVTPDWEVELTFEGGTDGVKVDSLFNLSKYSNTRSYAGSMSCAMSITSGTDGWGDWGGQLSLPGDLVKGDTFWWELYIWMPSNPTFIIDTLPNGSLKFYRLHHKTSGDSNLGFYDFQIVDDAEGGSQFRMIKETTETGWITFGSVGALTRGSWQRISVCQKLDNVLQGSGGTSRTRVWLNGTLLVDDATAKTMSNATDICDYFYLFTYWNGDAPQTQTLWVDNIYYAKNGTPTRMLSLEGVS